MKAVNLFFFILLFLFSWAATAAFYTNFSDLKAGREATFNPGNIKWPSPPQE